VLNSLTTGKSLEPARGMGKGKADGTTIGKLFNDVKLLTERMDDTDRWRKDVTPGGESERVIVKMLEIEKNTWLNAKKMTGNIETIDRSIDKKVQAAVDAVKAEIAKVVDDFERKSRAIMQGYSDISAESTRLAETIESHIAEAAALQEGRLGDILARLEAVELKLADINSEHNKTRESDVHMQTQMHFSTSKQTRSIGRRARSLSTDRRLGLIRDEQYQHEIATLVRESQSVATQRSSILHCSPSH
jgi:hypothetical protein